MSTSSVVVAIAGGVGAAVGASLGQFVQWWREHERTKIEERRREEDRTEARARERRDREQGTWAVIGDEIMALNDLVIEVHVCSLEFALASIDERGPILKRWESASTAVGEHHAICRKATAMHGTSIMREYISLFARFRTHLRPPYLETEDDDHFGYNYLKLTSNNELYNITSATSDKGVMRTRQSHSYRLILESVGWALERARFDSGLSDDCPDDLPYELQISKSIFGG